MYVMLNIIDIEDKIPDITKLATKTALNAKINEVKNKIANITNSVTYSFSYAVENKIPDHSECIHTPEFNKLGAEFFFARLKQAHLTTKGDIAYLVKKTDFDNKPKK